MEAGAEAGAGAAGDDPRASLRCSPGQFVRRQRLPAPPPPPPPADSFLAPPHRPEIRRALGLDGGGGDGGEGDGWECAACPRGHWCGGGVAAPAQCEAGQTTPGVGAAGAAACAERGVASLEREAALRAAAAAAYAEAFELCMRRRVRAGLCVPACVCVPAFVPSCLSACHSV